MLGLGLYGFLLFDTHTCDWKRISVEMYQVIMRKVRAKLELADVIANMLAWDSKTSSKRLE